MVKIVSLIQVSFSTHIISIFANVSSTRFGNIKINFQSRWQKSSQKFLTHCHLPGAQVQGRILAESHTIQEIDTIHCTLVRAHDPCQGQNISCARLAIPSSKMTKLWTFWHQKFTKNLPRYFTWLVNGVTNCRGGMWAKKSLGNSFPPSDNSIITSWWIWQWRANLPSKVGSCEIYFNFGGQGIPKNLNSLPAHLTGLRFGLRWNDQWSKN